MTNKQALEKLELEEGATSSEISAQYQEFYNEFQMRITNAPTEHQRTLYKKKLDELTLAFETLGGQQAAASSEELPGIAESIPEKPEPKVAAPVADKPKMTKEKALQFLGLAEEFSKKELDKAFKSKLSACEAGRDNAITDSIKESYEEAITQCNAAYQLLEKHVFVPVASVKPEPVSKTVSNDSKKTRTPWLIPTVIVGGVAVIVLLFFIFNSEGQNSVTQEEQDKTVTNVEYIKLKTEADLLAKLGNWEDALAKYEGAFLIVETTEVKDSIESMKNQLLLASAEKDDIVDEQIEKANADKEKDLATTKKEKELVARENALKEADRLRQEKEADRLRQEKESKRIKIGDNYAGGIVFKIDASGIHGLVCASKDQGKFEWGEGIKVCGKLTLNGYSDWYLPSKQELNLMYTQIGQGSSIGNVGGFASSLYWSSTEKGDDAWLQNFGFGNQLYDRQSYGSDGYVRAVRAF